MKIAITALTKGGIETGKKIVSCFPKMDLYIPEKYNVNNELSSFEDFTMHVENIFNTYDGHIFIMATGIVVRKIARLLKSKTEDPAVVVVDEKGVNAISLLSGHIGGANEIALRLSDSIGSNPIITTSSDINKLPSVDMFAIKNNLIIDSMEDAKIVTAFIVNKKKVGLIGIKDDSFDNDTLSNIEDFEEGFSGYILVTNKLLKKRNNTALLIKRNIVLGLGCRRDKTLEEIENEIIGYMKNQGYDFRSLNTIVSIDLKKDEKGLLEFCNKWGIKTKFYSSDELLPYEGMFNISEFVKKTVGVGNVCDTSGYRHTIPKGRKIGHTYRNNGITLSMWEE